MLSKLLRLLATILIYIYIYFRFIKQRLPTVLYFYSFDDNLIINYYLLLYIMFFVVVSYIFLLQLIRDYYKITRNYSKIFILKIIHKIVAVIKTIFKSLYEYIVEEFSYEQIRNFCLKIQSIFEQRELYIIFMFLGLPYVIIPLALVYDTFVFFSLNYFYKTLFLLSLPIIYNVIIYIITDIASNITTLQEEIDCINIKDDEILLQIKDGFDEATQKEIEQYDIPEYHTLYTLNVFLDNLKHLEDSYKPWFLFFMFIIYLFCWSFILFFNLVTLILIFI